MWKILALLSAVFAALTSILAKFGIKNINSTLATAVRTVVVLILAWVITAANGNIKDLKSLTKSNWIFLILSGAATGLSWICYFKAIQAGEVSKTAAIDKFSIVLTIIFSFIILKEAVTFKTVLGCILITAGTLVMIL